MLLESLELDLRMRGHKPATIADYCWHLRELVPNGEPVVPLTRVSLGAWIHEGKTPSVRRHRYLAVNALCRMLVEDGELATNPCSKIPMPKEPTKPQPILEDNALERLLLTCNKTSFTGVRDRAMILTLASTGCRRAELVAIRMEDLALEAGQVMIRTVKGGKWRIAYLDAETQKALMAYLRLLRKRNMTPEMLFCADTSKALSCNALTCMLRARAKRAGVVVSAHMFRRRAAVKWLKGGGSQVGLMNALGWTDMQMPARYTQLAAQEIAQREWERMQ